jgi:tRNA 2-thiouridine synthesizing protein E
MQTTTPETRTPPAASRLFDEEGFLHDHRLWTEDIATDIAAMEGLTGLTEAHWRVLRQVRGKFERLGAIPNMRQVCRETRLSKDEIYGLFGNCLAIWRIAGLPYPGEEAKSYMS